MREQLDAFYMHIGFFIEHNFEYPQTVEIINTLYSHDELRELLDIDDPGFAIFGTLASTPSLKDLLLDFCLIYPDILKKSLHSIVPNAPKTLMELFEKESMVEILEWLKTNNLTTPADANIRDIQSELITLIEHDQYKNFKIRLSTLSPELIHQTIHQPNQLFLDTLLSADPSYITLFIELDISILHVIDFNHRVLDSLCESPKLYHRPLNLILTQHKDVLSPDDLLAVETALHKKSKIARPEPKAQGHVVAHHGLFSSKCFKKKKKEEPCLLREVLLKQTIKSGFPYPGLSEGFAEDALANESIVSPP